MAFKEKLNELIDAKGGKTPGNLAHISDLARKIQPYFTPAYLSRLMLGHPPQDKDYQALGAALGVSPTELIDDPNLFESQNSEKARKFASERMNRPDLAEQLIKCIEPGRFRKEIVSEKELYLWFNTILELLDNESEDEKSLT